MPDVPATPKPWAILQALETALQRITVANGFRTDVGGTVSLEKVQNWEDAVEGITLYSSALSRPAEPDNHNTRIKTREFEFIIEAAVPVAMQFGVVPAHQRMHDIIEDIEQSLAAGTPSAPGAIPAIFREVVFADRPHGLPVVVAQYVMVAQYRRAA